MGLTLSRRSGEMRLLPPRVLFPLSWKARRRTPACRMPSGPLAPNQWGEVTAALTVARCAAGSRKSDGAEYGGSGKGGINGVEDFCGSEWEQGVGRRLSMESGWFDPHSEGLQHCRTVTEWIPDIPSSLRSKENSGMTKRRGCTPSRDDEVEKLRLNALRHCAGIASLASAEAKPTYRVIPEASRAKRWRCCPRSIP
jgi:hypothetical protein